MTEHSGTTGEPEVDVLIALWPHDRQRYIRSEIDLIKATYLYADRITVLNPSSVAVAKVVGKYLSDDRDAMLANYLDNPEISEELIEQISTFSLSQLRSLGLNVAGQQIGTENVRALADLYPLLTLDNVHSCNMGHMNASCLVNAMESHVRWSLDHSAVIPTFESQDAQRAVALLNTESRQRSREVNLSNALLELMPSFSFLTADELHDVKNELRDPLIRYRSAVASLASELTSDDLTLDIAHDVWRRSIAPELSDIRSAMSEGGFLRQLGTSALRNFRDLLVAGATGFGISHLADVNDVAQAVAGVAGSAGAVAADAYLDRREVRAGAKRSRFFYLYGVSAASTST